MPGPEPTRCPDCGQPILVQMPLGLCPCCLVRVAMPGPAPAASDSSAATTALLPQGFGDYEILEEIGRGGMGLVYKARQKSLSRVVALKMMLGGRFASAQARARFKVEAEATAHLQHRNIVAIHEVGEHEGLPYLVMDYVQGRGLDALAREQPLPARSAATYVESIAEAIAYAHGKGVLHRDLKPSNVLIDDSDQVRITDFGLAKRLNVGQASRLPGERARASHSPASTAEAGETPALLSLTLSGQALGSPNYMPPEQAAGRHQRIGPASDVYGMGATLYYLITGRPPFVGETISATTRQVMENEPISPRLLNPKVPRDLETICLKCLEKDPAKRYAIAQELADELGRFLRDEPILARPPGALEKGWRWCRRKPTLAGLVLMFLLGVVGVTWQWRRAVESARVAQHHLYVASMNLARQSWEENQMGRMRQSLRDTRTYPDRGFEWFYLRRLAHPEVRTFRSQSNEVSCVVFTPDNRQLVSSGYDGTARVWDIETGQQVLIFKPQTGQEIIFKVSIRPDGAQAACRSGTNDLQLWDPKTGRRLIVVPGAGHPFAYSADGRRVLAQRWKNPSTAEAAVWDANTGEELLVLRGHVFMPELRTKDAHCGAFSPHGHWIVTGGGDSTVRMWDATTGEQLRVLTNHTDSIHALAFSPDSTRFVSASRDKTAILWDAATGQPLRTFPHQDFLRSVAYSPDGLWIVTGGGDQTARIWDVESGREIRTLRGHSSNLGGVAVSRDGKWIATASADGTVKLWDTAMRVLRIPARSSSHSSPSNSSVNTNRADVGGDTEPVLICREVAEGWELGAEAESVGQSPSQAPRMGSGQPNPSRRLPLQLLGNRTCGTLDTNQGTVALWDLETRSALSLLSVGKKVKAVFGVSADRNRLLVNPGGNAAEVWDVPGQRPLFRLQSMTNVVAAAFSPDGRRIVTDASRFLFEVWDAGSGTRLYSIPHSSAFRIPIKIAISQDSQVFVNRNGKLGVAQLWSLSSGNPVIAVGGQSEGANAGFSSDGKRIVVAGDQRVTVWDRRTGREVCGLIGHAGLVTDEASSPDGRRVVTGSYDRTVRVWNSQDGRELLTLRGHGDRVAWVAFSPNGQEIYSVDDAGTLRIWLSTPPEQARLDDE